MYPVIVLGLALATAVGAVPANAAEPVAVTGKASPTVTQTPASVVAAPGQQTPVGTSVDSARQDLKDRVDARKDVISERKELGQDRREVRTDRQAVKDAIEAGDKDAAKAAADQLRDAKADRRDSRTDVLSGRHDIREGKRGLDGIRSDRRQRRR